MPQRFRQGSSLRSVAGRKAVSGKVAAKANSPRPPSVESSSGACVENLESRTLLSTSYFVSPLGSDNNVGSISKPFRTIQRAANVAVAGDHVEIRAGTYHEDVTPKHSGTPGNPIVFDAYHGEAVTVTGADPITSWSSYGNSIYKASMPWTFGEGNDQVFVDGRMINEARWPNTSLDVSHPTRARASSVSISGSSVTIHDPNLTQPAGYWKGGTLIVTPGEGWISQSGTITNSGPGFVTFSLQLLDHYEIPKAGNAYYITGTFKALDSAGEWYRDASGTLYVRTPSSDSPAAHDVEAKHRLYAFDLSNEHDITIQGVGVFGATINSNSGSRDTVINNVNARYVGQFIAFHNGWGTPTNTGIVLNGPYSVLENSTIAYSAGDGIYIKGAGSQITNNVIHDVAYSATDTAAIHAMASGLKIDHNTIYNAGRSGILHSGSPGAQILYNTIHDVSLLTTEAGGTYTVNTNGAGAVVAYNKIYNIHSSGFGSTGVFLDNNSSGFLVHNNSVSNVDNALKLNFICRNDTIYSNTFTATIFSISTNQKGDWTGTRIYNNVFNKATLTTRGGQVYNNSASSAGGHGAGDFASGSTLGSFDPPVIVTPPPPTDPTPPPTSTATSATSIIQAENWSKESGVKSDNFAGLGYADGGDWAEYAKIDFGKGVTTLKANISALAGQAGSIELHLDSPTGALVGTLKASPTGAWNHYTQQSTKITGATGVHDVYLVFKGGKGVANVDWFTFA